MMRCCFDKRVWIGFGVLAAGLLVADPRADRVAVPVLGGLACPVSMLFMMRSMRHGTGPAPSATGEPATGDRTAQGDRAAQIARLRDEIRQLKEHAGYGTIAAAGVDPAASARGEAGEAGPAGRGRFVIGR
jgi:hypothetical protein